MAPHALTGTATPASVVGPLGQRVALASSPTTRAPEALSARAGAAVASHLSQLYGERLKGLYLYGARALGEAEADAEVELLVVLDEVDRYGEELERTSLVCASLTLALGVVVSRVFVSQAKWEGGAGGPPAVRAEAIPL